MNTDNLWETIVELHEEKVLEDGSFCPSSLRELKQWTAHVLTKTILLEQDHYETLSGERPTGSKWGHDFDITSIYSFKWNMLRIDKENKLIFLQAPTPEGWNCTVNAERLGDLTVEECESIEVYEGNHGPELVSTLIKERKAEECTMICGMSEHDSSKSNPVIYTVYPGLILDHHGCKSKKELKEKFVKGKLSRNCAVKGK
jgi:hypothetical protein